MISVFSLYAQAPETEGNMLPPLFESDELLKIKITGDVKSLIGEKGKSGEYFPLVLTYFNNDTAISIDMKARTRGHFRRTSGACILPPILLNFPENDKVSSSVFAQQNKLKMVVTCKLGDYVEREFLIYKLSQLLSPYSFKVRMVEITFEGEKLGKYEATPFIGYLIEGEEAMAKRNGGKMISESEQLSPAQINLESYLSMLFFQYMIANVDWSIEFQHNIKLVMPGNGELPMVVPYDFDHAGLVNTPYAKPPEELQMYSVRERRYRGPCNQHTEQIKSVVALFTSRKAAMLDVYRNTTIISEKSKKDAIKFLEAFFEAISDEKQLSAIVNTNCDLNRGGHIIVNGLKKNKK